MRIAAKVLLDRRFRGLDLQHLQIGGNMERLDIGALANPMLLDPGEEVADGSVIGHARVVIVDRGREKIQEAT
jgi:hypothetical protein